MARAAHPDDEVDPLAARDGQRGVHVLPQMEDAVAHGMVAPLVRRDRHLARDVLVAVEEQLARIKVDPEVDVEDCGCPRSRSLELRRVRVLFN